MPGDLFCDTLIEPAAAARLEIVTSGGWPVPPLDLQPAPRTC